MHSRKFVALVLSFCVMLSACATDGSGPGHNETIGTVVGTVLGAVIGGTVAKNRGQGAAIGAVLGGLLGNRVGSFLDARERRQMAEASYRALSARTGERISFGPANPAAPEARKQASGYVRPVSNVYVTDDGQTCRDLERHADKMGRSMDDRTRACMVAGQWALPEN